MDCEGFAFVGFLELLEGKFPEAERTEGRWPGTDEMIGWVRTEDLQNIRGGGGGGG